jgi:hypothetical protein
MRASTISSINYMLANNISLRWQRIHVQAYTNCYTAGHQPIYNLEKANELHILNYAVIKY